MYIFFLPQKLGLKPQVYLRYGVCNNTNQPVIFFPRWLLAIFHLSYQESSNVTKYKAKCSDTRTSSYFEEMLQRSVGLCQKPWLPPTKTHLRDNDEKAEEWIKTKPRYFGLTLSSKVSLSDSPQNNPQTQIPSFLETFRLFYPSPWLL